MPRCLLGIGANLGDPAGQIDDAVRRLTDHPQIQVQAVSRNWTTPPVGGPAGQAVFLNAAALIETDLSPDALLDQLQIIEDALGRTRSIPWDARPLDLDILLYGAAMVRQPSLRIPHPSMVARRFVLGPAAEIAPQQRHPLLGWSLARLWQHANSAPPRFALVGCRQPEVLQAVAAAAAATLLADVDAAMLASSPPSPVPDFCQQLELLKGRVEKLQQGGWNETALTQPLLCAFWIDESLVAARHAGGTRPVAI